MLGLGQSLSNPSFSGEETFSYFKETIESSDGWSAFGVEGSPTIQYNQTAPDSSTGWLKLTFDQSQTNFWALANNSIMNDSLRGVEAGVTATIKHDVYLHSAALWGSNDENDDDVISWSTFFAGDPNSSAISPDSAVTVTSTHTQTGNPTTTIQFRNGVTNNDYDLPLANAVLYIKNIDIQVTYP